MREVTREIQERGDGKTPKYIDHGHIARKAVFYGAATLVMPLALVQLAAIGLVRLFDGLAVAISRLRVWSHPCLYGKRGRHDS